MQQDDERYLLWWERWWRRLDIWWPVLLLLFVLVPLALWFRNVELWAYEPTTGSSPWSVPRYQATITPPAAAPDPMTVGDAAELLIVPLALAAVAYTFSIYQRRQDHKIASEERQTERDIARARNEEAQLQTYFDRMGELMLKENLRSSGPGTEVRTIARARTIAVLRSVEEPMRKKSVLNFLYESELIRSQQPVLSLYEADLRQFAWKGAALDGVALDGADLRWANLQDATLQNATLVGTFLDGAALNGVNLEYASLLSASLKEADLSGAILTGAILTGANLDGAILVAADLRGATIDNATNFEHVRYNNRTIPPYPGFQFPASAINVDKR